MRITKPGTYQAKNATLREYIKILLWGSGYPFGLLALGFGIVGIIQAIR